MAKSKQFFWQHNTDKCLYQKESTTYEARPQLKSFNQLAYVMY